MSILLKNNTMKTHSELMKEIESILWKNMRPKESGCTNDTIYDLISLIEDRDKERDNEWKKRMKEVIESLKTDDMTYQQLYLDI